MSKVKDKLKKGEVVYGQMILELFSAGIGPMLHAAGMEFVLYDMEHGRCDISMVAEMIALSRSHRHRAHGSRSGCQRGSPFTSAGLGRAGRDGSSRGNS